MKRVLVVEPDRVLLDQYCEPLARSFEVDAALTAQEAIDFLDNERTYDLIVMDFQLGKNNGVEFLQEIRSYDDWIAVPVIVLSTLPKTSLARERLARYGVEAFLYKPQTAPHELLRQAQRTIEK